MCRQALLGTALALVLLADTANAGNIESGPPVGSKKLPAFNPRNVTGPHAGTKTSLVVRYGSKPVAMIFAREISPELITLLKKLDEVTAANASAEMGAFVVFCRAEEGLDKKLEELAAKEKIRKVILTISDADGPKGYSLAREADITVVLYVDRTVKANHAFKKGTLQDRDVEAVVKDVAKIVPPGKRVGWRNRKATPVERSRLFLARWFRHTEGGAKVVQVLGGSRGDPSSDGLADHEADLPSCWHFLPLCCSGVPHHLLPDEQLACQL